MFGGKTRSLTVLLACAVGLLLAGGPPAHAADTTIAFDNLASGITLTGQYAGQGAIFSASLPAAGNKVTTMETVQSIRATSSPNAARTKLPPTVCGQGEFPEAPKTVIEFTDPRNHVTMRVGAAATGTVTLRAFDIAGQPIAGAVDGPRKVTFADPLAAFSLARPAATADIGYVTLEGDAPTCSVQVDDLTFDVPAGPAIPRFLLQNQQTTDYRVRAGGTRDFPLKLKRFGGSNGNVQLAAYDEPGDVHVSFSPNPVPSTQTAVTMTVKVDPGTPNPDAVRSFKVGASAVAAAGTQYFPMSANFVTIPAYEFKQGTMVRKVCGTAELLVELVPGGQATGLDLDPPPPSYTGAVTLTRQDGFDGATTFSPSTIKVGQTSRMTIGGLPDDVLITGVRAQPIDPAFPPTLLVAPVITRNPTFKAVSDTSVNAPKLLAPGDTMTADLSGFCVDGNKKPNPQIAVGNERAIADDAVLVSEDTEGIQRFRFSVPRLATPGPLRAVMGGKTVAELGSPIQVGFFRKNLALGFSNTDPNHRDATWGEFSAAYGYDEVHVKVDPCSGVTFGKLKCKIATTPVPGAVAYAIYEQTKKLSEGRCYGFSAFVARHLTAELTHSGPLSTYDAATTDAAINRDHISQFSQQSADRRALEVSVGSSGQAVRDRIAQHLKSGPALLSIRQPSPPKGHALLAYNIRPTGAGNWLIDTYDPNQPITADELSADGELHRIREDFSAVLLRQDGSAVYPAPKDGDSPTIASPPGRIYAEPVSALEKVGGSDLLSNAGDDLGIWALGTAATPETGLKPGPGGRVFSMNVLDANTDLPPRYQLRGATSVSDTRTATGDEPFGLMVTGRGVLLEGATTLAKGATGGVAMDAKAGAARLDGGAGKPSRIRVGRMVAGGGSRMVTLQVGAARKGAATSMAMARGGGLVVKQAGAAGTATLAFNSATKAGLATLETAKVQLPAGATATMPAAGWKALARGSVTLTVKSKGRTRRIRLRDRGRPRAAVRVTGAKVRRSAGAVSASAKAGIPRLKDAELAYVAFVARRGRKVLDSRTVQVGAPGQTATWSFRPKSKGKVRVEIRTVGILGAVGKMRTALSKPVRRTV